MLHPKLFHNSLWYLGDDANGNSEEQREKPVEETNKENPPSNSTKRTHDDGSAQREDKVSAKDDYVTSFTILV